MTARDLAAGAIGAGIGLVLTYGLAWLAATWERRRNR